MSGLEKISLQFARLLRLDRQLDDIKINQGRMLAALNRDRRLSRLRDYEFKVFSQWGEDGIIQHLIHHLAITNHTFIEFGVEDFSESNCRFLLMHNYWQGYVLDGCEKNIRRLCSSYYYWRYPLKAKAAFVTRENVVGLLNESGFGSEPGILSIDLDGVDWHVLSALRQWRPSVLIVEYNALFGFEHPVSVPYDPCFQRRRAHWSNLYWGASLPAFVQLAGEMEMALVGTNAAGNNAFFVRRTLLNDWIKAVPIEECTCEPCFSDGRDQNGRLTFLRGGELRKAIEDLPLINVITGKTLRVGELGKRQNS